MDNLLVICNKNYSSWSLRPWLLMREKRIPFRETRIPLYQEGSKEAIAKYSPSGKVPCFQDSTVKIWDSLAICEYIAEKYPEKRCWPSDPSLRALARSISAEMHSGFPEIRRALPMNCRKKIKFTRIGHDLRTEIARISGIWEEFQTRSENDGNFLVGDFSVADAMYAPVVLRFFSYGIDVGAGASEYMKTMLGRPSLQEWIADGQAEIEVFEHVEVEA